MKAPGLQPIMPQGKIRLEFMYSSYLSVLILQGAMYMLIRIQTSDFEDIENDKDFFTKLNCEESISCLPASVSHFISVKTSIHITL